MVASLGIDVSRFIKTCLFASMVSVRFITYLTDVNVPASIAATTGTITIFFLTHSNLDNLIFFFTGVFRFRF